MLKELFSKKKYKIIYLNIIWLTIFSFITLMGLEIYVRYAKPKFFNWTNSESKNNRIKKAIKNSESIKDFRILVGDSHAANLIGTKYNLFDNIFQCSDTNLSCSYLNLSEGGTSLPDYWNNLKISLRNRQFSKDKKEKIIISIYYGNDFNEYINIKYNNNQSKDYCPIFSKDQVFHSSDNDNFEAENLKIKFKRYLPSINLVWRIIKANLKTNIEEKESILINGGKRLRQSLALDPLNKLDSVEYYFKNIDEKAKTMALTDQINRWEIGLSIANPYYFNELYSLNTNWSRKGIDCMQKDIKNFHSDFINKFPNSQLIFIGIPDKLIWKKNINQKAINEYKFLGYKIDEMVDNNGNLKNEYFKLSKNMEEFFESNQLNYIYLPSLVNKNVDIYEWFYKNDMHINLKGNLELSKLLSIAIKNNYNFIKN